MRRHGQLEAAYSIGLTRGQIELAVDGLLLRRGEPFTRPPGRAVPAEDARDELQMAV